MLLRQSAVRSGHFHLNTATGDRSVWCYCATRALCFASGFVVFPVLLYVGPGRRGAKRSLRWVAWTATLFLCSLYFMDTSRSLAERPRRLLPDRLPGVHPDLPGQQPAVPLPLVTAAAGRFGPDLDRRSAPARQNAGYYADVLLVLIGIAAMTAFFRHPAGVEWALNIRYGVFSSSCPAGSHNAGQQVRKCFAKWLLPLLLVGLLRTFFFYPEMALTQEKNLDMIRAWQNGRTDRPSQPFSPTTPKRC